jgi:integrase/recombinase XerC
MHDHLPTFLRQLAHRSPRTLKTYGAIVASFFAFVDPDGVQARVPKRADVEAFLARPRVDGGKRSPASWNQELAALRAFVKFARRELGWIENPTDGIPFAREAPHDPAVLSIVEVQRLLLTASTASRPPERSRNLAILAVLASLGLRVHEIEALNLAQFDIPSATLVGVRGKGETVHDLPLNSAAVALLLIYLADRPALAAPGESALFASSRGTRFSIRSIQRLLKRLRITMGTLKKVTPHTLRHSVATILLTLGVDISTVAEILRHSDLNTTRRYLHLVDERRREAVRRLGTAIPEGLLGALSAIPAGSGPDAPPSPMVTVEGTAAANDAAPPGSSASAIASHPSAPPVTGVLDVQQGLGDMDEAA